MNYISAHLVIISILLASIVSHVCASQAACVTEYSVIIQTSSENITLRWESLDQQIIPSNPPCVNADGEFMFRECVNGTWYPEDPPKCHRAVAQSKCVGNEFDTDDYCVLVTPAQVFDASCPKGYLKYFNSTRFDSTHKYWSPLRRIDGVFTYIAPDAHYGKEIDAPEQKEDCNVFSGSEEIPANCSMKYHQLCIANPNYNELREQIKLQLVHEPLHNKLWLSVYSARGVLTMMNPTLKNSYAVYCFTNADKVEEKVPLRLKLELRKKDIQVYQTALLSEHPGEYWCAAFDQHQHVTMSNRLLAYKKKRGNEYALRAFINDYCIAQSCTVIKGADIMRYLHSIYFEKSFFNTELEVRLMRILRRNGEGVEVILHLTTLHRAYPIGEFYKLQGILANNSKIQVIDFRSADYCMPEVFANLYWRLTSISKYMLPREICLNHVNMPVKRYCLGNFIEGAIWDTNTNFTCYKQEWPSSRTESLYNMTQTNKDLSKKNLDEIEIITQNATELEAIDVYFVANIISQNSISNTTARVAEETTSLEVLIQIMNNLFTTRQDVLEIAQVELNATDSLLDSMDKLFAEDNQLVEDIIARVSRGETFVMVRDKFVVHITRPSLSQCNGIAIYNSKEVFTKDSIVSIHVGQKFEDLEDIEEVELATFVPLSLLQNLADKSGKFIGNITVITIVYFDDNMFNSREDSEDNLLGEEHVQDSTAMEKKSLSKVINVRIPGFGIYLEEPLPLFFRKPENVSSNISCAFWQFGELAPNKTGRWSSLGGQIETSNSDDSSIVCHFNHLTHFALLIMSQRLIVEDEYYDRNVSIPDLVEFHYSDPLLQQHDIILSTITIIGSSISLCGVLGIFLTAALFSRWRQKAGTRILLQMSLTIMLEIVVVHVAGLDRVSDEHTWCSIVGICLHYAVLAKCSWMFVSAMLQYLRFVKVLQAPPNRLMLKAMLFAWGGPIIPVTLVGIIFSDSYSLGMQHFCYPTGWALYLGLFMPVVILVTCNLIVFVMIMKNVFSPNVQPRCTTTQMNVHNRLQIYLGILLFFMLGIPWIFGILSEILQGLLRIVCVYLFCLTATLQGAVIFLFYVVVDQNTRGLWIKFFKM